jgi:hypothetical protein
VVDNPQLRDLTCPLGCLLLAKSCRLENRCPINTGCRPLGYSGNPGANGVSDRGDRPDVLPEGFLGDLR